MTDLLVHRYRCDLDHPISAWTIHPYIIRPFRPASDGQSVHALIDEAHDPAARMTAQDAWWQALEPGRGFDPGLAYVIETPIGTMVAAAIASPAGQVRDIAVAPAFRRMGLATVLLSHLCQSFQRRGAPTIDLEVRADNHGAIALYEGLAWRCVDSQAAALAA